MFRDLVEISTFTLEQIAENRVKENSYMELYDVYRQLDMLLYQASLVISYIVTRDKICRGQGHFIWIARKKMVIFFKQRDKRV